jgi:hypothetical protein
MRLVCTFLSLLMGITLNVITRSENVVFEDRITRSEDYYKFEDYYYCITK